MVVASSSGRFQSMARLRSRIGTAPSTLTEPSGCGRTPGTGMSCSSEMSPTISSRMSSSVTSPIDLAVLVDHQREVRLAAAERLELLRQRTDVGHEPGRQRDRLDVDLGRGRRRRCWSARSRSLACRMPTMFSGVPRHSGMRVNSALSTASHDLLRRIVGVDRHHLGAVDHHVGDFELAEPEDVLDVFGLADLHLAVLGGDLHEPLDLDVGQDFLLRALLDAEHPQDRARRGVEQPVQRIEHQEADVERIRDPQRHRHRLADRQGLRHLLADDDMQRREHQEADHERREMQRRVGHPERDQQRAQQRGDGRLADPAEAERGHRDAELAAREIGFDVAQHLLQQARARSGSAPPAR